MLWTNLTLTSICWKPLSQSYITFVLHPTNPQLLQKLFFLISSLHYYFLTLSRDTTSDTFINQTDVKTHWKGQRGRTASFAPVILVLRAVPNQSRDSVKVACFGGGANALLTSGKGFRRIKEGDYTQNTRKRLFLPYYKTWHKLQRPLCWGLNGSVGRGQIMENWSFWAERNVKVAGAQSSCGGCSRVQREGKGQQVVL